LRDAKAKLESFGLKINRIIDKPDLANNNVLGQKMNGMDILPGEIVEKGSKIDLIVGKITDKKTYSPSLISLSVDQAKIILDRAELNLGAIVYEASIENDIDSAKARIWKQVPSPSSKNVIRLGGSIDVWLKTIDSEPEQEETESL
jgi:beta-lactam-binding protein with PASTA domain